MPPSAARDLQVGPQPVPTGMKSWFAFIPREHHADIAEGRSTWDATATIQKMLDEVEPGSAIYCPGQVNIDGTLLLNRSVTLQGNPGRDHFDNSWEATPASTVFRQRANAADLFRIETQPNVRINVVLRDLLGLGNRFADGQGGRENPAARQGRILAADGGTSGASQVRLILENFAACNAVDQGADLAGNLYGSRARDCFFFRNGKQGLRARGGSQIGECHISGVRLFQNGFRGGNQQEQANFDWQGGQLDVEQMSSSEAAGAGIRVGGLLRMNSVQIESCGLDVEPVAREQFVLGDDGAGVLSADIRNLMADPGDLYEGAVLVMGKGARNVRVSGRINNALGPRGVDIARRPNSGELDLFGLSGLRKIRDESADFNVGIPLFVQARHPGGEEQTGDGSIVSFAPELLDQQMASYDPASGLITAPCNCTLDLSLKLQFQGIADEHVDGSVVFEVQEENGGSWESGSNGGRLWVFNPARLATGSASGGRGDFTVREPVPLRAGARARFRYWVNGGARTIRLTQAQSFLSIRTWRGGSCANG